ncbi:unnamed protein product, partial [Polarella glacialis]
MNVTDLASYTHILVYSRSLVGQQNTPAALSFSEAALSYQASGLTFVDQDLDVGQIGGSLTWEDPQVPSQVLRYNLYLAQDQQGSGRSLMGTSQSSSAHTLSIAAETELAAYSHLVLYSESEVGEQSTSVALAVPDTSASVSSLQFLDQDADASELGGQVTWSPPGSVDQVTEYHLYVKEPSGGNVSTYVSVPVGTNFAAIPAGTSVLYSSALLYTQSSLAEQSTPVFLMLVDSDISPVNVALADKDLDAGEVGGSVTWDAPSDEAQVVQYAVYLARDSAGAGRSLVGYAANGNSSVNLAADTEASSVTFSHVLAYTITAVEEQTAPSAVAISDVFASVSGIAFLDNDL